MGKLLDVMYIIFYIVSVILGMTYQRVRAATTAFRHRARHAATQGFAMRPQSIRPALGALLALALGTAAFAHPPAAAPAATGSTTKSLQGDDAQSWINDAHIHAFYDTTVAAFAQGPSKIDVDAYEQKSFAIFREFGASRDMSPAAMQDHLKLIPRQVVGIVKEDPKVLDSYANFVDAVFGPQ